MMSHNRCMSWWTRTMIRHCETRSHIRMNEWVLITTCKPLVWSNRIRRNMPIWILCLILGSGPVWLDRNNTNGHVVDTKYSRDEYYDRDMSGENSDPWDRKLLKVFLTRSSVLVLEYESRWPMCYWGKGEIEALFSPGKFLSDAPRSFG